MQTIPQILIERNGARGGWDLIYTVLELDPYAAEMQGGPEEVKEYYHSFQGVEERLRALRIKLNLY